jgi:hypothetical protein
MLRWIALIAQLIEGRANSGEGHVLYAEQMDPVVLEHAGDSDGACRESSDHPRKDSRPMDFVSFGKYQVCDGSL